MNIYKSKYEINCLGQSLPFNPSMIVILKEVDTDFIVSLSSKKKSQNEDEPKTASC